MRATVGSGKPRESWVVRSVFTYADDRRRSVLGMSRPHSDAEIAALIAATRSLRANAAAGHVSPP